MSSLAPKMSVAYLQALPPAQAAVALVLCTAACTVSAVIPTTPLNFAAGIICGGLVRGSLLFNAGATLGSLINFVLGRRCFRTWAQEKLRGSPLLSALEGAIAKRSAFMIALARLSPVFPFAVLGYVLGATKVKATTFTWATFVGLIPGVTLYTFIGMSAAAAAAAGDGDDAGWSNYISIGAGVIATVVISWQAKKIIEEATASVKKGDTQ